MPCCYARFACSILASLSPPHTQAAADGEDDLVRELLPNDHGYDTFVGQALGLLSSYEAVGDCMQYLSDLPLYQLQHGIDIATIAERYQAHLADLCQENINSHAALEVVQWMGDTAVYPLLVLLEATSRATAIPMVFWIDLVYGFFNSVLHKRAYLQLTERYQTKNRHWVVGTANVAEGKSPAMSPLVEALEKALEQHSAFAVGSVGDQFHLQQAGPKPPLSTIQNYIMVPSS